MVGRIVRRGVALALGAAWWWAALRLATGEHSGVLEGAVVAGGWGLSLLPVHCVPRKDATGAVPAGRWTAAWRTADTAGAPPRSRPGDASDLP
ncbi:hypothetical protein [Streptomyces sp. NPDC006193]|uniref:hypothetical protein n=1 Tax=Streptomyces sp. NPDC006193 TaxID=3155717 RepID=UPI00339FF995